MLPEMNSETSHIQKSKKQAAVIGNPIKHSHSPLIHNHFLKKLNIDAIYEAIHIESVANLPKFLNNIRSMNWAGINVTIPYKEHVIAFLDEVDNMVEIIGACNTIVNKNGKLYGFNTDAAGFAYPLGQTNFQQAMILGNGGSAKAVLYQCAVLNVKKMILVARDHSKTKQYIEKLKVLFNVNIDLKSFNDLKKSDIKNSNIIVNSTSIGLNQNDDPFEFVTMIGEKQIFYDLIYNPWETKMMKICKKNGAKVINGAPMLAHQGALAFEKFFNQLPSTNEMIKLLENKKQ